MTTDAIPVEEKAPLSFIKEVSQKTPGDPRLTMCIQCGTCGGSCPSAADMDHSPRRIFALIRANMRDEVFAANTPWFCISCYLCIVRCPQEVHIVDIMYTLKNMAIESGNFANKAASDLSQTFVDNIENYGRSFEFGLATRHYLRHQPLKLLGSAQMGLGMLSRGRLDLTPHKIEGVIQLRAILAKAKELEAPA